MDPRGAAEGPVGGDGPHTEEGGGEERRPAGEELRRASEEEERRRIRRPFRQEVTINMDNPFDLNFLCLCFRINDRSLTYAPLYDSKFMQFLFDFAIYLIAY